MEKNMFVLILKLIVWKHKMKIHIFVEYNFALKQYGEGYLTPNNTIKSEICDYKITNLGSYGINLYENDDIINRIFANSMYSYRIITVKIPIQNIIIGSETHVNRIKIIKINSNVIFNLFIVNMKILKIRII